MRAPGPFRRLSPWCHGIVRPLLALLALLAAAGGAVADDSFYDELPLGRVVAAAPLSTARPTADQHVATTPLVLLREKNFSEHVPGDFAAAVQARPAVTLLRLGSGAETGDPAAGYGTIVATPAVRVRGVDADFELGLAPFEAHSLASSATWHAGLLAGRNAALISNLGADLPADDWLVGPPRAISSDEPLSLTFDYFQSGSDSLPSLRVYVSTSHPGGPPNPAQWQDITPPGLAAGASDGWRSIGPVAIPAMAGEELRVAFRYVSSGSSAGAARLVGVDDVAMFENSYLPPEIDSFTADGVELADGAVFSAEPRLVVVASNLARVARAEFAYRPLGASEFTTLGEVVQTSAGMSALWRVAQLPDGEYELAARLWNGGKATERVHRVSVALAPPEPPLFVQPAGPRETTANQQLLRLSAADGALLRLFRNGAEVASGRPVGSAPLSFTVDLATGPNVFTATAENRAGSSAAAGPVPVTRERPVPVLALELDSDVLVEGDSMQARVSLAAPLDEPLEITLSASRPTEIAVGPPQSIPAGETSVTFTVTALDDSLIQPMLSIALEASAPRALAVRRNFTRLDNDIPQLTLVLSRQVVSEGDGPNAITATLTRSPAVGPLNVQLVRSQPAQWTAPGSITFAPGEASVSFPIGVLDNDQPDGSREVTLQARLLLAGGVLAASSETLTVTITDDDSPRLRLLFGRDYLREGVPEPLTVRRETADLSQPLEVELGSSSPRLLVPATVTIPAGQREATALLDAPANEVAGDSVAVTVGASAAGHSPAQLSLVVVDGTLPDLVTLDLDSATRVATGENFNLRYRIENRGLAATASAFVERVYLSRDSVPDASDLVLAERISPATLAVGGGYDRQLVVRAPQVAGSYWLIVVADAANQIGEIVKSNNTAVFASPVEVGAAYGAVVRAAEAVYPANTPIPLEGAALREDGSRVPFAPVNLHISRGPTTRVISAITDAAGEFLTTWTPLPGEGGDYTIGAAHPGESAAPVQDAFSILSFGHDFPSRQPLVFDEGGAAGRDFTVRNPSASLPLGGVRVEILGAPAGLDVSLLLPGSSLPAGGRWDLRLEATAAAGLAGSHPLTLRLLSDEGVVIEIPVTLEIRALTPLLVADPGTLRGSVLRGGQTTLTLTLRNDGGAASGPIDLLLPNLPWLRLASASPLPSIPAGGTADLTLLASPPNSQPLSLTTGSLVARPAAGQAIAVPFELRTVSALRGDLVVEVVDEFFYFTEEAPLVSGATVVVRDAVSAEEIARASTPESGRVSFPQLAEGHYQVEVSSPRHTSRQGRIFLAAGDAEPLRFFISRQLVTYSWRVEEVEIADRYEITVETTFETNVPAPVITISPGRIDVADLVGLGQTKVVNLTIENHGLIAAEAEELRFDPHPFYRFEPLVGEIGTLAARSSLVVPVVVTRIGVFGPDNAIVTLDGGEGEEGARVARTTIRPRVACAVSGGMRFSYPCGPNQVAKDAPIAVSGVQGNCAASGPGGTGSGIAQPRNPPGGGTGGGWTQDPRRSVPVPVATTINFPTPTTCDCLLFGKICAGFRVGLDLESVAERLGAIVTRALPPYLEVGTVEVTIEGDGELCVCCRSGRYGLSGGGELTASVKVPVVVGRSLDRSFETSTDQFENLSVSVNGLAGGSADITGTITVNATKDCGGGIDWCVTGSITGDLFFGVKLEGEANATLRLPEGFESEDPHLSGKVEGQLGISGQVSASVTGCNNKPFEFSACASVTPVAFVTGELSAAGGGEPRGFDLNFPFETYAIGCGDDGPAARRGRSGEPHPGDRFEDSPVTEQVPASEFEYAEAELLARVAPGLFSGDGVCAQVRVSLSQQLVLTRSAFQATLELTNNQASAPLSEIGFDLVIRDAEGLPADDEFNVRVSQLRGLDAADGSGSLAALATGSVQWTLIPRDTAAPLEDSTYFVGGTIRYSQGGTRFSIPVASVPITVRPDASLHLKYFHQRDVFADDPFTPAVIEPSEPFALAVLVENRGAGDARNLSISSAQPRIVDNEKGLLIDFEILATRVNGEPLSPGLAARFGDLPAGSSAVGVWLMRSSLQGLFTSYEASFEHLDGLGDERISLIRELSIHEMIRMVEVQGALADGLPDFLTNDVPDFNDFPDTVHFSHGGSAPVLVHQNAAVAETVLPGGGREIELSTPLGAGWSYLRIPDPLGGGMVLVSCVRSDGCELPLDSNVWRTDRTFPGLGQRARRENLLHLFDGDSTGSYTLTFAPAADEDTIPPESLVQPLAEHSPALIPLAWSGSDEGGVAWFDVFVSTDEGPWELWLGRTSAAGALFEGEMGRRYAFYSRATDLSGNVEPKAPVAESFTTVSLENAPPLFNVPELVEIDAGRALDLTLAAEDPDGPDSLLRFELVSGPAGMTLDPLSGRLRWPTSAADGGRSLNVGVRVNDGGLPAASTSANLVVTVRRVNTPPVLDPVSPRSLAVGQSLLLPLVARDFDQPAQTLAFSIRSGAPTGMSVDPASGLLRWTPASADAGENFVVELAVTDDGEPALSATRSLALSVAAESLGPPVFDPLPTPLWLSGRTHELEIHATDPDGSPVAISSSALPPGATLEGLPGSGRALLRWQPPEDAAGYVQIPLRASSPGELTSATLTVRVENPDPYWEWAARSLGSLADPADYGPFANPDGDDAVNLIEMIFLRDPLVADHTPIDFAKLGDLNDDWSVFRLEFLRHQATPGYARIRPMTSDDAVDWQPLNPWAFQPFVRPLADDVVPDAEAVELRLLVPRTDTQGFFQLETTILPQWLDP